MTKDELHALRDALDAVLSWPDAVRDTIAGWLTTKPPAKGNGLDHNEASAPKPRPISARSKPGSHPNMQAAAEAEAAIVALLKDRPNLKTAEVAKATGAKVPTTVERLKRLRAKGLVQGGGNDGFHAIA